MFTYDKKNNPIIKQEVMVSYEASMGETVHTVLQGLKERKLLGCKCSKCKRVLFPARTFCSRCFIEINNFVELSTEGTLVNWAYTSYEFFGMPVTPPYISGQIRLDGVDGNIFHLIGGFDISDIEKCREILSPEVRLKAVWEENTQGCIMDIKYFKPEIQV